MSKKDGKDPSAVIVIRRLLEIIDLGMVEDLQRAEYTLNVSKNLELASSFGPRKGKNFFSRSSDKINKILHKTGTTPIFGHQLSETGIDRISVLIDYLKKHVESDGIFRISGNKKRQDELRHLLDKDMEIDFENDTFTEHDIASILKLFLAELPEPVIVNEHIEPHMQIIELDKTEKQIQALQLLFLLLPPPNRHLLQQLLDLLADIAENKTNRMSASNLAVCFAPSVMHYKHKSSSCLSAVPEDIMTFTAALTVMIENAKSIFDVPDDLLREIENCADSQVITTRQGSNGKDGATLVKSRSFCPQLDPRIYSTDVNKSTADNLVDLYSHVAEMEDTPMKRAFMKKYAQFYPGTPPFKPKMKKATEAKDDVQSKRTRMFTTPRIKSPRLRSLSGRLPLQAMSTAATHRYQSSTLCDSPTGSFRSFHTPVLDCRSLAKTVRGNEAAAPDRSQQDENVNNNNTPEVPETPSGHFLKTPLTRTGSFRNPFKRKRRTRTIGSPNEATSSHFTKPFSAKPKRASSSSELEEQSSVELRATITMASSISGVSNAKKTKPAAMATPVMKKSLVGRDIRNLYSTPRNSKTTSRHVFSAAK